MSEIEQIEDLLKKHIGENKSIVDVKIENLVAPGENYGGELLKLEFVTRHEEKGTEEIHYAVAKKIPPNEFAQKMFNIQQTFKGEINFYDKVVPALQNFQRENGVKNVLDCFAKCYGARINLDENSEVVDKKAVIMLENLHISGFMNVDRHVGYDFESAELLLRDLASLHAVPLAMKLKDPEMFENKVKRYCVNTLHLEESEKDKHAEFFSLFIQEILWESDKCSSFIPKVKEILKAPIQLQPEVREPFATFSHADLWVNNAMIKMKNGTPVANKFVDFQIYTYGSPASDLLFFLFTSVRLDVLKTDLDTLINHYHSEFIKNLTELGCDTTPFQLPKFKEELALEAKGSLGHILMFLCMVIFGEKNKALTPPPQNGEPPDMTSNLVRDEMRKNIHSKAKEKIWFTIQSYGSKGWL
ncbi:uncharacterized protein [Leptinotarsa decemlineata]|uniref:uncharacterized protein n=1 Tax=Leptinotarsa decemlineata TaxID=7539 RepID=UPI003D307FF2